MLKLPDGTVKVLVEGGQRARVGEVTDVKTHFMTTVTPIAIAAEPDREIEAMRRTMVQQFDQYVKLNKKIPPEILTSIAGIDDASRLADQIAAHLPLKLEQKQEVAGNVRRQGTAGSPAESGRWRTRHSAGREAHPRPCQAPDGKNPSASITSTSKSRRSRKNSAKAKRVQTMTKWPSASRLRACPRDARKKAEAELKKLKLMSPMSAEATVVRNFIEALTSLPWRKKSKISTDLAAARKSAGRGP